MISSPTSNQSYPAATETVNTKPWLLHAAPVSLLTGVTLLTLVAVVTATLIVLREPWLGLHLEPSAEGLRLRAMHPAGPAAQQLQPGQLITSLAAAQQPPTKLADYDPGLEPHTLATFQAYTSYVERMGQVWAQLQHDTLSLSMADGSQVELVPAASRPLASLPLSYWLFHLFGAIALLISLGVWAFRRGQPATRFFALAGLSFFAATWTNSLYLGRELAFEPSTFLRLSMLNHLALYAMIGSLLALLLYFPRRLFPPAIRYILPCIALLITAILVNEQLHIIQLPLHDYYLPIIVFYLLGAFTAVWQWRAARGRPLDRAALRWFFLSLFISTGMGLLVYFIPTLFKAQNTYSQVVMVGFAASMYIGLALGILRYRLFDLELWWFRAWLWFFGGLAVLLVDAAVVFLFGLQPMVALGIATLAVGWVYFPIRQWLWGTLAASNQMTLEDCLPILAGTLPANRSATNTTQRWQQVLTNVFNPLSMQRIPPVAEPALLEQGARLQVPVPNANYGLELLYNQHGARLFSSRDLKLCQAMFSFIVVAERIHAAQEEGAQEERRRIMRDLHDDVGARILSLIHNAQESRQEQLARAALQALRESIYSLDDDMRTNLSETAQEWQMDVAERLQNLTTELIWISETLPKNCQLTTRQTINLKRIMHEAISNALVHAQPHELLVKITVRNSHVCLDVYNDGVKQASQPQQLPGRGLHNMQTRADELGGTLMTGPYAGGYAVKLRFPITVPAETLDA